MAVTTAPPAAAGAKKGKGKKGKGDPEAEGGGGGKKKLVLIVVAVLAIAGGVYWFFFRPTPPPPPPEPGEVVSMEPIQVNLAGGHYLKIGVALQLTTAAHEADGSKALDAVIELFSNKTMDEVTRPESRDKIKHKLMEELEHDYHGDVMDVYFTDFVTQ